MIAGEETAQLISDVAEAWDLIRNSLELYGKFLGLTKLKNHIAIEFPRDLSQENLS